MRWPGDRSIELESVENAAKADFVDSFEKVTDEQWRSCDALVSSPDIPAQYHAKLDNCRVFVTPRVGFDNIDLAAWGKLGIPVCNVPDYGTMEVADHAIALMLTLMKGIEFHAAELRADPHANWRPALNPYGRRLSACTFGVLGIGRIGTATALRAKAFGMRVIFYDPYVPNGTDLALGVTRVDALEMLFSQSDVVSVHTPLTDETRNLVDARVFAASKPGLMIVNTARGEVIDLDALHDAMKTNKVLAAGLDVLPKEPPDPEHPLIRAFTQQESWLGHRLTVTPHSAFFTPESVHDMRYKGGEIAVKYLRDGRLENCVNVEYLTRRR
jgi:lactate dehydrogenase-like 2-hydroxyacid dehydrogenase